MQSFKEMLWIQRLWCCCTRNLDDQIVFYLDTYMLCMFQSEAWYCVLLHIVDYTGHDPYFFFQCLRPVQIAVNAAPHELGPYIIAIWKRNMWQQPYKHFDEKHVEDVKLKKKMYLRISIQIKACWFNI